MISATIMNSVQSNSLLISYIEVWVLTEDGQGLELSASRCPGDDSFRRPTADRVAEGEGIAGRAWHQKSATVLQEKPSELIETISQQCGVPLEAVIAIPVYHGLDIQGVVVLGLGAGYGAVEVWTRDERDELSVAGSHYSGLTKFEFISRYVRFPKGSGAPGNVWKTGRPQMVHDPAKCAGFIRSFDADPAHLTTILGLPIGRSAGFAGSVLLLLESEQNPLARETELWTCEPLPAAAEDELAGSQLLTVESAHDVVPDEPNDWRKAIVDQLAQTRKPALIDTPMLIPGDFDCVLAFPVFNNEGLISVWALVF